ncbi:MAG: alpha/beta hydrolase [Deltaproteobacteria bacterium]|nr:MAG: alpha/beta hydrolase [Deltaproteobacteria bacterium]
MNVPPAAGSPTPAARDGAPVLLLPGLEGVPQVMHRLGEALSPRPTRVQALPTLRRDHPCTVDRLARAVIATLGPEPVHLFGASLGGLVARRIAAREPGRVLSLTTLGALPAPRYRPRRVHLAAAALAAIPDPASRRLWAGHLQRVLCQEAIPPADRAAIVAALPPGWVWPARLRAVCRWNRADPLSVPTLWLRGRQDREAPWTLDQARACLPGAVVAGVPGGHRAMLSHPRALAARLAEWLARVEGARRR